MGISWRGNGGGGELACLLLIEEGSLGHSLVFLVVCVWVWYSAGWE